MEGDKTESSKSQGASALPTSSNEDLVTPDDHDAGYKDVEVEFRSGKRETVRLHAPSHRKAVSLFDACAKCGEGWPVLYECLSNLPGPNKFLDRISPFSATLLLEIAWAMTYGSGYQKKILELGAALRQSQMSTTPDDSNSSASSPASPAPKSEPGACPS